MHAHVNANSNDACCNEQKKHYKGFSTYFVSNRKLIIYLMLPLLLMHCFNSICKHDSDLHPFTANKKCNFMWQ